MFFVFEGNFVVRFVEFTLDRLVFEWLRWLVVLIGCVDWWVGEYTCLSEVCLVSVCVCLV